MTQAASSVTVYGVSIDAQQLESLQRIGGQHAVRAAWFVGLYLAAALGAWQIHATYGPAWWTWVAAAPLYLMGAAALHGISLFTHEGVHGALSANAFWNRWLSIACALPVLQNFSAYKVLHLKHHRHLGQEGDPDHYPNYSRWTWLVFLANWLRLIVGYPVYITMIPILGYRQGEPSDRRWIVGEVAALVVLLGLAAAATWSFGLGGLALHGWLIPMLVINTMVNIRGMSQHTLLEDAADPVLGTRSILTNPVTRFFMCNENYHLEHHLFPRVPWYNLDRLHGLLHEQLATRGAPFIRSYWSFVVEFAVGSWRRSPWGR